MVTVDAAVHRRSSWCDLYKVVTTGILWVNAAQIITRQMTQQRNEESRELVDCLTQVQITSIGIKRLFMGFIKYTFELDTSIFSSSTTVSIWLSAPTLSPLNDEFQIGNNLGITTTTLMQHSASFLDPAPARARTLVGSSQLFSKQLPG